MEDIAEMRRSNSPVPRRSMSMHGRETRTTGSWMEILTLALGSRRHISRCRPGCLGGDRARGRSGGLRRTVRIRGRCIGSRATDGEVTTRMANRMLVFLSATFFCLDICIVLEGRVDLIVAVAMGT